MDTLLGSSTNSTDENQVVVIDNGSDQIRAGFAGDEAPYYLFSTVVGRPKIAPNAANVERNNCCYVGEEALHKCGILRFNNPIKHGIVKDWDDMEQIWLHCLYNELRIAPEEHPFLLTESPFNPKENREKATEMMFETFETPAFCIASTPTLSLYASGRVTGVAIDSGYEVSYVVPIHEGYQLNSERKRIYQGGREVTGYLEKLLSERGYSFNSAAERNIVRDIKEKLCYSALDFDQEMSKMIKESYELPDGQILSIGQEMFKATETIFQPALLNSDNEEAGLHESTHEAIMKADINIRKDLCNNCVLSGGNTMFPGIAERMQKEMIALSTASRRNIKVISHPKRHHYAWIGGSILASLSSFQEMIIKIAEYDDVGPSIVHTKCNV